MSGVKIAVGSPRREPYIDHVFRVDAGQRL